MGAGGRQAGPRARVLREGAREAGRVVLASREDLGEEAVGQEADVLGEEAEDDAVEESGHGVGFEAAVAESLGECDDALRGVLGDLVGGDAGAQAVVLALVLVRHLRLPG